MPPKERPPIPIIRVPLPRLVQGKALEVAGGKECPLRLYPSQVDAINAIQSLKSAVAANSSSPDDILQPFLSPDSPNPLAMAIYSVCCVVPARLRQQMSIASQNAGMRGPLLLTPEEKTASLTFLRQPTLAFEVWRVRIDFLNGDSSRWMFAVLPAGQVAPATPSLPPDAPPPSVA